VEKKMVTLTISLEDELAEALHTLAERNKLTEEELIKRVVEKYVIISEQGDDPLVGLFDLGEPQLAEHAEDVLL
jgi:predicted transcriptional regulator